MVVRVDTMTDHAPTTAPPIRHANASDERRLRLVLRSNALTSGLGGLIALAAPGWLDELLGTGRPGWIRLVGAGLVAFAGFVALTSRASTLRLARVAPLISLADAAWVAGSVLTIAAGWYSTSGAVLMASVGVMVGAFSIAQAILSKRVAG